MTKSTTNASAGLPGVRGLAPSMLMIRIALCLVALWALYGLILFETRRHAWNEASTAAANMATLVEGAIAREIEVFDLTIRAVANASNDPAVLTLPPNLKQRILFGDVSTATMRGRTLVIGADGTVVDVAGGGNVADLNFSDRDYFVAQRERPDAGLFIGGPLVSRITHAPSIVLSRRRADGAGRFNGVVAGAIRLEFFTSLFTKVRLPRGGSITLLKRDGTIMTRVPFRADYVGMNAAGVTVDEIASGATVGAFRRVSFTDGVDRLYSFHQVGDLPLVVNVGFSVHEIFATWRLEMLVMGMGFGLLSLFIVTLGLTLAAELRRRSEAERCLADLACTDHLTLLANRRRFDDVLNLEWRRAARGNAPVSLLMVDCDYFKSFNDTYGHPAGDRVLRAIAASLATCVDRPGDLVARFGGEEFAVLLPATDEKGAMIVATALRAAVDALDLAHAVTPTGRLTVSIGLASLYPTTAQTPAGLVEAADTALYRAKREGRDRIVPHQPGSADVLQVA